MFRLLLSVVSLLLPLCAQPIPGRYILELEGEPLAAAKAARAERAAAIGAQHQVLRSMLAGRKVQVRGALDTVANAIVVENADPDALRNLPGVKRVVQSRYLQLKMDHAMNLLRFPDAWVKAGGRARAGAGMKIAIIDTGIDNFHLAFQDEELSAPEGFPLFSPEGNKRFTSAKVIVARSYGGTAQDLVGHGTAVASAAASAYHLGPRGVMAGSAPKAWLGNYNVAEGTDGAISIDNTLRAIDDAVKDGMDVINLSLGGPAFALPDDELFTPVIARAAGAGAIVIVAAGNEGPDNATPSDTASSQHVVAVGASENDRLPTSPAVLSPPSTRITATPASNSEEAEQIAGKFADVATIDPSGLACNSLPGGSLAGKIALILRGTCNFAVKFVNARNAGAVAAVVYNSEASPSRVIMQVDDEPLKGLMISRGDGTTLKNRIAANGDADYVLFFSTSLPEDPNRLADFSSRGPGPDMAIKPDMVATGTNLITATNETPEGSPELSGYLPLDGTSLSSPIVAGVAAVLKQVRPGLTPAQYRSVLINSSLPFPEGASKIEVQKTGAGLLQFSDTLSAVTAIEPASVSFGEYRGLSNWFREITVTNIGAVGDNLSLSLRTNDALKPELSTETLTLAPKGSAVVKLTWNHTTAGTGAYQGFLEIRSGTGSIARVPYWLGVRGTEAKEISLTYVQPSSRVGTRAEIYYRVLDGSGISLVDPSPEVTVSSGGGSILQSGLAGSIYPGVNAAVVRLGPSAGVNVFTIKAGGVSREVRIRATN
ncbi:MAG: S8 family serine peptidase [Bryobacterales bacterium]|nr:S8 family serine peptidase [Bryobacterales bacterium]